MTLRWLCAGSFLFFVAACGGTSDTGLTGDSGTGNDSSTQPDGGNPSDGSPPTDGPAPPLDGGPDSPIDFDAGFSPFNLPGLALWLDAEHKTTLDGNGRLQTWGDLSGNNNDASQPTASSRPGVQSSSINNLPAVHFESQTTGPFLQIADSTSLQWGTGDFSIAIVARFSNNPAMGVTTGAADFYWKSTFNGTLGAGVGFLGNIPQQNYTVLAGLATVFNNSQFVFTTTAYNDGTARLYFTRRAAAKLELRVNGNSIATQTTTVPLDVSAPGTPVYIGAIGNGVYYRLNGDIAEMIAVKGAITDPDLASLEGYLKAKYGL